MLKEQPKVFIGINVCNDDVKEGLTTLIHIFKKKIQILSCNSRKILIQTKTNIHTSTYFWLQE